MIPTLPQPPDAPVILLRVAREDLAFLNGLLETYDDLAVIRTLDPPRGLAALMVSPGEEETVRGLLESLARDGEARFEVLAEPDEATLNLAHRTLHALA
jgi:hypothetical protein